MSEKYYTELWFTWSLKTVQNNHDISENLPQQFLEDWQVVLAPALLVLVLHYWNTYKG